MSRNKNASVPEVNQTSSASNNSAPQLPVPSMATPIDESAISAYFANRDGSPSLRNTQKSTEPAMFSPISESTTNERDLNLDRTISTLSQEQSPQSGSTVKQASRTSTARQISPQATETAKPDGTSSTSDVEEYNHRISTDLLNPSSVAENARDSSVSDVSSVSDHQEQRQSLAVRTISPPLEPVVSRDAQPPLAAKAVKTVTPQSGHQSHHAPSYSTAMASGQASLSKDVEAAQDREEEQILPAYDRAQPRPPRVSQGAEIVPIARITQDQRYPRPEPPRPFSFVGSESLIHSGHEANRPGDVRGQRSGASDHSYSENVIAQPGSTIAAAITADPRREQNTESPLPSARHKPEDFAGRTPEEFARLRQNSAPLTPQPPEQGPFRIPGPYGQELRSPRPKISTPGLDQYGRLPSVQSPQSDGFESIPPTANALAVAAEREKAIEAHRNFGDNMALQQPPASVPMRQQRLNDAANPQDPGRESDRDWEREPRRQSKFMGLFRSRSKSQSRRGSREFTERRPVERPDSSKRNSLLRLGSRGSITATSGQPLRPQDYDDSADDRSQASGRMGIGARRISKDMFKNAVINQQPQQGHSHYVVQHERTAATPVGKKKRFSGLFGKSAKSEAPVRASTVPSHVMQTDPRLHGQPIQPQAYRTQPDHFQNQTLYAESRQRQQHRNSYRTSAPGQDFHGVPPPAEGYYGGQQETNRNQPQQDLHREASLAGSYDDQASAYANPGAFRQQALGMSTSPYQHENRTYQYEDRGSPAIYPPPMQQRPDLPRLDTGDNASVGKTVPASAPAAAGTYHLNQLTNTSSAYPSSARQQYHAPQQSFAQDVYRPPSTRANKDISYGSEFRQATSPSAELSRIAPRVAALHVRSRSPRLGRPDSGDYSEEHNSLSVQHQSPVAGLGTFNSKNVSPAGGIPRNVNEQEKPWTINLPQDDPIRGGETADPASATSSRAREMRRIMLERTPQQSPVQTPSDRRPPTVAERFMGVPTAKTTSPTAQISAHTPVTNARPHPLVTIPGVSGNQNQMSRSAGTTTSPPLTGGNVNQAVSSRRDGPFSGERADVAANNPSRESSQVQRHPQQHVVSAPPTQMKTTQPLVQRKDSPTPPPPAVNPPPAPDTVAAMPKTTNEAGLSQALSQKASAAKRNAGREKAPEIHEMPGSKPEGYESEEEPVMSATAYPGQEWQPVFDRWED